MKPLPAKECATDLLGANALCLTELSSDSGEQDKTSFGYNWTHPDSPLDNPFIYRTAEWLGSNPEGTASANPASLRLTPGGGYTVIILPFFSDLFLPEQRGTYTDVNQAQFKEHRVTMLNKRAALYFCVRTSWNTQQIHQICDPMDSHNRSTGVVPSIDRPYLIHSSSGS